MTRTSTPSRGARWTLPLALLGACDDTGGSSGSATSSGGELDSCACTCDELAATDAAAEEYKTRIAAGEQPSMGELGRLSRCVPVCQREYMVCRMEQADREKEAEEQAREEARNAAGPCDCSCEALAGFDARAKELQSRFAAGGTVSNEALEELVHCAQECQAQHIACRMKGMR